MRNEKEPTNSQIRSYNDNVVNLGCIIPTCRMPAEIHHIRDGQGMGKKASWDEVLPLCPRHHRTGGFGIAFHAGSKTWQRKFGNQRDLLMRVREALGYDISEQTRL